MLELANGLWTIFSLIRPVRVQEKTLLAMFGKTLPAVSEEGLTNVFKKSLVACACEWPVDYVQLSPSGCVQEKTLLAMFGKTLWLCLRKALAVSRDFA